MRALPVLALFKFKWVENKIINLYAEGGDGAALGIS
jgi:hypothetical protein